MGVLRLNTVVNIYKTSQTHSVSKVSAITFGNNALGDLHIFGKDHFLVGAMKLHFQVWLQEEFKWSAAETENQKKLLSSVQ